MAGFAEISSSFIIQYTPTNTAATVITNPGRSFRVVGVLCNNTTGGALTCALTDGSNAIVTGSFSCAANTGTWCELTEANLEITSAENLTITCSGVGLSPVEILCVASNGGQALTAT